MQPHKSNNQGWSKTTSDNGASATVAFAYKNNNNGRREMGKYSNTSDCIESQDISDAMPCQLCTNNGKSGKVSISIDTHRGFCIRCDHCGFSSQMFGNDWVWDYKDYYDKLGFYEMYEHKVILAVASWNRIQTLVAESINN